MSSLHLKVPLLQRRWFVAQNLINLRQNLWGQLLLRTQRLHRLINLLRSRRARDRTAHALILQHPRHGEDSQTQAQLLGHGLQLLDLLDLALPVFVAEFLVHALHKGVVAAAETRVGGDAVVVFPGQDADFQGREDGEAEPGIVVQGEEVAFDFFAREEVVLWLFNDGADEVEASGVGVCGGDFGGCPL